MAMAGSSAAGHNLTAGSSAADIFMANNYRNIGKLVAVFGLQGQIQRQRRAERWLDGHLVQVTSSDGRM